MDVRLRPGALAALVVFLLSAPRTGLAGTTGMVEIGYGDSNTQTVDQAQQRSNQHTVQLMHRYRLGIDRQLFPKLSFLAAGSWEQALEPNGVSMFADAPPGLWNVNAALTLTDSIYGVSANYQTNARATFGSGSVRTDSPGFHLFWRPTDLPSVSVRVAQHRIFDAARVSIDRATTTAQFSSTWAPVKEVDLGYNLMLSTPEDRLTGFTTRELMQGARAAWTTRLFDDRTTVAASLNLSHRMYEVVRVSQGGTAEALQAPQAGGTAIEDLPSTATDITLTPNASLVDGNASTTSGVNLGYAPSLAGDQRPRHLGVEFGDPLTGVNRIHVLLDRTLPPGVAGNFTWTAYRSDDGRIWSPIQLDGLVRFNELLNRFEIPLTEIETRHVKVVTRPLAAGVTIDPQYSEILVTELQAFHVTRIEAPGLATNQVDASATASARTRITENLSHDVSLLASAAAGTTLATRNSWSISNGLSWRQPLSEYLRAAARVSRVDADYGQGASGMFTYGASLTATPLATLSHALVYGGQANTDPQGWNTRNSLSLLNNLTPYRGVGLMATATASFGTTARGEVQTGEVLMLTATVQPHARLTLTSTVAHAGNQTRSGSATLRTRQNRLEGGASFSPFNSLYLSGNLSWMVADREPVLLGNSSIAFSPFPGGALQMGVTWSQALDPSGAVGQYLSPNLRWTIRRGLQLNASYTLYDSGSTVPETSSQTFSTTLQLVL